MTKARAIHDRRYRQTQSYADSQARYRARDPERVRANHRLAQQRRRARLKAIRASERAVAPGTSAALDGLRASLKTTRDPETRRRIEAAIARLEALHTPGAKLKAVSDANGGSASTPRTPGIGRVRSAGGETTDHTRPTGRAVGSWMDGRLPPE